ncbi:MAG: hypothetical protein FJ194_05015 [Gammaproteobacteria bacterium]|nr:hypothetical protein [Gammaproteobacteria bacterium]
MPDHVLLEWYFTDLDDNIRSRLFVLKGDELERDQPTYLPVSLEQCLLEHWPYRLLAENSMFFAWLRAAVSLRVHRWMAAEAVEAADARPTEASAVVAVDPREAPSVALLRAL